MNTKNMSVKQIVLISLMIACVTVGTMVIHIPMPSTNGYVNIGDTMIFISSILFGPVVGMIAGGIGSALADLLSGYAHWALFTLIIKGLEGYLVGIIIGKSSNKAKIVLATLIGASEMVIGYYIAGGILEGSFIVALESIPGNIFQGVSSAAIGVTASLAIMKTKYVQKMNFN